MIMRITFASFFGLIAAACSVENTDTATPETERQTAYATARLIGSWNCESVQQSDGQTLVIQSVETYAESGEQTSKGALKTAFQGIDIRVDLRSNGEWALRGNQLARKTQSLDVLNFKANGSYAAFLPLEDLERELRKEMRASVRDGVTDLSLIQELTDNRLVILGSETNIRTECTR